MKYGYNTKPLIQRKNRKYNKMQCIQYKKSNEIQTGTKKETKLGVLSTFCDNALMAHGPKLAFKTIGKNEKIQYK